MKALHLKDVNPETRLPSGLDLSRVCYWHVPGGRWWIYIPKGGIGELKNHITRLEEDGTLTVQPSIGFRNAKGGFKVHGFLEGGVWRDV